MSATAAPLVLLAAGGTGGHLFPAEALAGALARRGIAVGLATDARGAAYGRTFPARDVHVVASETLRARTPWALARTVALLAWGGCQALLLLARLRPAAVVGFGGYPSLPPLLAATVRGVPTVIHEQNSVLGRANRFLAPRVTAIATGFAEIAVPPALAAKVVHVGNPLRPAVLAAAAVPYAPPAAGERFRLLVFGGSQGARVMAEVVPDAVAALPAPLRARLTVVQQARAEDVAAVTAAYAGLAVDAEVAPFFADLPARMAASHLVIARAGASTVAELAAIGRPALLVPLPHALDQDQAANAAVLERAGGALTLAQSEFTPRRLAHELALLLEAPPRLAAMAAAARTVATVDADERLADLVLRIAGLAPGQARSGIPA
jgi:UDP-N-acetylglucosamine--N-acetylmuramyl-(pentapeptide) pyrophosphoryl-undecaprenol N-acetylglucosamine transferase